MFSDAAGRAAACRLRLLKGERPVLKVPGRHAATPPRAPIAESYNRYYGSGLYDVRYPRPNPPTYRSALRLARTSSRILDFGAGSGRYAMPFLHATNAFVCAYDTSADACKALDLQAAAAGAGSQRMLITADLDAARAAGPYDLVVALFGVLPISREKKTGSIPSARYARCSAAKACFSSRSRTRFAAFPCMHHRKAAAAKTAVRLPGLRRAVTSPRPGRLSTGITSRMRRCRFPTTYTHAASWSQSYPLPVLP
jgi:SAM-dependent methyltransferase